MSRTVRHRRLTRSAITMLLGCAVLSGCSGIESGMMAVTVDGNGAPVGIAVGCRYRLEVGRLERWVADPAKEAAAAGTGSTTPTYRAAGEIASWDLPVATGEIVAWPLHAADTVNDVKPLTGPPRLAETNAYRLIGTFDAGHAQVVQFTLGDLRHLEPGQAMVRDRDGEPRIVDLNQLVDIACTDAGLDGTRSPQPTNVRSNTPN